MATLARWRGREIDPFRRQMERLVGDFFGDLGMNAPFGVQALQPAMELYETEDAYEVIFELPGVNPEEVKINVAQNTLTIHGERISSTEEPLPGAEAGKRAGKSGGEVLPQRKTGIYSETFYGSFSRSVTLPGEVNRDQVKATYKDGLLRIELPKAEEMKPKAIEVKRLD